MADHGKLSQRSLAFTDNTSAVEAVNLGAATAALEPDPLGEHLLSYLDDHNVLFSSDPRETLSLHCATVSAQEVINDLVAVISVVDGTH
jgi:hypothetical protein